MSAGSPGKQKYVNAAAVILSLLMILSMSFISAPYALADEGTGTSGTATAAPQTTDSPQPTDTPEASESPQPTDTPEASESPQPTETPEATDTPEPSSVPEDVQCVGTMSDGQKIIEVDGKTCVDDEVIVKFKDSATDSSIVNTLDSKDSEIKQDLPADDAVLTAVPEGETVPGFIDEMEDMPDVEYVQPNYVYTIDKTVNDPYANSEYQWYLDTINAYDAWNITMGSSDIKVADIDTGIDLSNTEFAGKISDQWDYVNKDGEAQDDNGHGTFTAGIIAAEADNAYCIAGVAPDVQLIALKVLDAEGSGTSADVHDAIYYAVGHGAKVINMSFGGDGEDTIMEEAVNYAVSKGVVCVAAAGNDNTTKYVSPSDYAACISVIATDEDNKKAGYSNYGPNKDISAPGSDIVSTMLGGGCGTGSGTSFAAPMVSATAALMLSINPGLSVDQVKSILYSTAAYVGSSDYYGHGLVNTYKAVQKAAIPSISAASAAYNSIKVTWDAIPGASGYEVWRSLKSGSSYSLACNLDDVSYTNSALKAGTAYYYKIRAYFTDDTETAYGCFSNYACAKPLPSAPSSVEAECASYNSIKVFWNAAEGATGYKVYRATSTGGSYSLVKTTKGLTFTNTGLKTGTTYYYKVRSYTGSSKVYGGFSGAASAKPVLSEISWADAFSYSPTSVTLSWGSVNGRSGYEISRSLESGGTYSVIKSTKSAGFKNTGLIPNMTYYYRIRPYRIVSGRRVYGEYTTEISAAPSLGSVSGAAAQAYSSTRNKIYWNPVPGSSGYEVVSCDPVGGSEKHILYTKYRYAYNTDLKTGQEYYYKVRAYVYVGERKLLAAIHQL